MYSSATSEKTLTEAGSIPNLVGNWEIEIIADGLPQGLTTFQISYQEQGESLNRIFGNISSSPPEETSYAIRDGQVTDQLAVFFVVRIAGADYTFKGIVDAAGQNMSSTVTQPNGDVIVDGSWTAQAQSGG